MMVKRVALFFDGTWDRPSRDPNPQTAVESNVVRLWRSVRRGTQADGAEQVAWYDPGVGTHWYDRIGGGVFGLGLDEKIRQGYAELVQVYPDPDPGDCEVFVFGFSRGAYTARSLVGMIRNVGLLKADNLDRIDDAYALYRKRDPGADTPEALDFRANYSREIKIRFLGVWDTVGALGIPLPALRLVNAEEYEFHDTELSGLVGTAIQALAVDEHRMDYRASLWAAKPKPGQTVEQRWFLGAHCDVGGGYQDRRLSDLTLLWMQRQAAKCGLVIDPAQLAASLPDVAGAPIHDSYAEFLDGIYAQITDRFYRPIDTGGGTTQTLDPSVAARRHDDPAYRPKNQAFPTAGYVPLPWPQA